MAGDGTDELTGASWTLVAYRTGDRLSGAGGRGGSLSLGPDGSAAGSTGLNRFFGRWEGDAGALTVHVGGTTQMAGDDAAMAQEQAVLAALGAVTGWSVVDRALVLTGDDGEVLLTYEGTSTADLPGSSWTVTGVNNGRQAVVSSALTEVLTLDLGDDGGATGFAGCNRFTGRYELTDGGIHIGPLAATRKHCPDPEVMALEQQYLDALERSEVVQLDGDRLTLRDAGGATQVTLRPTP